MNEYSLVTIAVVAVLWTLHRMYVLSYRYLRTYVNRKLDDRLQDYHHWDLRDFKERIEKLEQLEQSEPESSSSSNKKSRSYVR